MLATRVAPREKKILELYCEQESVSQTDIVRAAIRPLESQLRGRAKRELEEWDNRFERDGTV